MSTGSEISKDNAIRVEHWNDFDDIVVQKIIILLTFSNKLPDESIDNVRAASLAGMDAT